MKDFRGKTPLISIDCEMVEVTGCKKEIARLSIVNYNQHVLFDEFFKPRTKVVNYLTWVSGITYENTKNAMYYEDLKPKIMNIFKSATIIGHSLHNDFKAL